ncbi:MAG: DUF11 domain-containing protein [Dehalococcoidia bacterium]|nr:DUF11 domain-containing protein [Dehalococcoidia bacterium]
MRARAVVGLVAFSLVIAAMAGHGRIAHAAATRTWTGLGGSNNWSDAANWDTGVPLAGDDIVFPASASRKTNTNDLAPNTAFTTIQFDGSGYAIAGNSLHLTSVLAHLPPGGVNAISLNIGGAGGVTVGTGKLILSGNNAFTGDVVVTGGVLAAGSDTALGSAVGLTQVLDGATLQLTPGVDLGAEVIEVAGAGLDGDGALQSLGGTSALGQLRLMDATTIGVFAGTLIVDLLTQGTPGAGFTLVGGGKLQVEGDFFAGPGSIESGNLTWNTEAQLFAEVGHFGLLRGTGMVSSVEVHGGAIWPGSGASPGVLSVAGGTMYSGGYFKVDLDGPAVGTEYGQLATGGLTLNPAATLLDVELGFNPAPGQVFRIINNEAGAVQGTFLELPEGETFNLGGLVFQISYKGGDGNDVTLTVLRHVSADLVLAMDAQPSPVAAGGQLVYTATVTNSGPDAASGLLLSMGTPVGTTFVSVSGPPGWACSKPSVSVRCMGPSFATGSTATFTLTFKVDSGAVGPISGTAGISAETGDPFSANNAVTLSTPVGPGGGMPYRRFLIGLAADSAEAAEG